MSDLSSNQCDIPNPCGWNEVHDYVEQYLSDYELYGENEQGQDACHQPSEGERFMITDAINGLLGDWKFSALLASAHKRLGDIRAAEGCCRYCGCKKPDHWGNDCPSDEPPADARLIRALVEITTGAFMARQVSHDTVQSILQKHGISGQLMDADGTLRTALPPTAAAQRIADLERALVYSAFRQHATPMHQLPERVALHDNDTVEVRFTADRRGPKVVATWPPRESATKSAELPCTCVEGRPRCAARIHRDSFLYETKTPADASEGLVSPPDLMFQEMEANTAPLTHQEIFSAVHHHAGEIVRLTAAVPAQCTGHETKASQDRCRCGVLKSEHPNGTSRECYSLSEES